MRLLSDRRGFTLLEAVLSIAILAVLLLAFSLMAGASYRYNEYAAKRSENLDAVRRAIAGAEQVEERDESASVIVGGQAVAVVLRRYAAGDVTVSTFGEAN